MSKMKECPDCGNPMQASASICRICDDRKFAEEQHSLKKGPGLFKGKRNCDCSSPAANYDGTCLNCGLLLSDKAFDFKAITPQTMSIVLSPKSDLEIQETRVHKRESGFAPEGILQNEVSMSALYVGGIGTHLNQNSKGTLIISSFGFTFLSKKQEWKKDLQGLKAIQIGGAGAFQTGGGFIGGGFGVKGAMEGIAMAGFLNALTSKTKFDCLLRVVYPEIEIYLQVLDRTPRQLTIDLTGISHYLENQNKSLNAVPRTDLDSPEPHNVDRLIKLAELLDKGLISREEFEAQKQKLI